VAHFLLGFHAFRHEMAATMSEIDIAYPKSPLSSGRRAGVRWDPKHYAGKAPGSDSPMFVLYTTDREKAAALTSKFPKLVEGEPRPSPDKGQHVVRPDGYVGLTTESDWNEVEHYLARLAG
jgi:hypothetical protein